MKKVAKLTAVFALGLFAAIPAGCGDAGTEGDQAAVDRELDLAMAAGTDSTLDDAAQAGTPAQEPAPRPTSQPAPRPSISTRTQTQPRQQPPPEPVPAGPRYEELHVPTGTQFAVRLDQELNTRDNQPGDLFTTTVLAPITDGRSVLVPAGAKIRGEVTAVQESGSSGESAVIKIAFNEISFDGDTYPVALSVVAATPTTRGRKSTGEKAATIGAGAVVGGILGRVIGGNATGTIVGGAVGAAAGTAIALGTGDVDAVLEEGSEMTLRFDDMLTVRREV